MFAKALQGFIMLQKERIREDKFSLDERSEKKAESEPEDDDDYQEYEEDDRFANKENYSVASDTNVRPVRRARSQTANKLLNRLGKILQERRNELHLLGRPHEIDEEEVEEEIVNHESRSMLRYGEYSPNNPKMRVATQPYLGLGEYEQRRQMLDKQRQTELQQSAAKLHSPLRIKQLQGSKLSAEQEAMYVKSYYPTTRVVIHVTDRGCQTDIQDVNSRLVQYDYQCPVERDISPSQQHLKSDKYNTVQMDTQTSYNKMMSEPNHIERPSYIIKNNSPRAKLMADLQSSYFPSLAGYTKLTSEDEERLDRLRRKEKYLSDLRQQIEEKQKMIAKHRAEEKREQELEAQKLQAQLQAQVLTNIQNELQAKPSNLQTQVQTKPSNMQTQVQTKPSNMQTQIQAQGPIHVQTQIPIQVPAEVQVPSRSVDRSSQISQSNSAHQISMAEVLATNREFGTRASKTSIRHKPRVESSLTHHSEPPPSPPLSRRDKRPPYSFNIPANSVFANSLPVKDSKSAVINTKPAVNIAKTAVSYTKLNESMPIPVLRAQQFPVSKELKNAVPVQSEAMRKLEDKWQIPAVQKNIVKSTTEGGGDSGGGSGGILTQLGAIRHQLQQEQLRLDETLRRRGAAPSSTTLVQADVHRNLN